MTSNLQHVLYVFVLRFLAILSYSSMIVPLKEYVSRWGSDQPPLSYTDMRLVIDMD